MKSSFFHFFAPVCNELIFITVHSVHWVRENLLRESSRNTLIVYLITEFVLLLVFPHSASKNTLECIFDFINRKIIFDEAYCMDVYCK